MESGRTSAPRGPPSTVFAPQCGCDELHPDQLARMQFCQLKHYSPGPGRGPILIKLKSAGAAVLAQGVPGLMKGFCGPGFCETGLGGA